MDAHSLYKSAFSFVMEWENDHEEIVRVANSIIKGNSQTPRGMCNFFTNASKVIGIRQMGDFNLESIRKNLYGMMRDEL